MQVQFFPVYGGKKKMCIIRQPVKLFTKTDTPVYFPQIFTLQCRFCVILSVISSVIFLSILFLRKCDGEKGWVSIFYYNFRPNFFTESQLNFHTCVPPLI